MTGGTSHDLSGYGPISCAVFVLEPQKDQEGVRGEDPNAWSRGYKALSELLERNDTSVNNRRREIHFPWSQVHQVVSIQTIAPNTVLVLFQTQAQAEHNRDNNLVHYDVDRSARPIG